MSLEVPPTRWGHAARVGSVQRSISFRDFWPGFDPMDNFFTRLLHQFSSHRWTVVPDGVTTDVSIASVFPYRSNVAKVRAAVRAKVFGREIDYLRKTRFGVPDLAPYARRNIWFTGENLRAPSGEWDLTLGFDTDSLNGRNLYLPLWVLYWPIKMSSLSTPVISQTQLDRFRQSRNLSVAGDRSRFCVAFFGNPEPMRFHLLTALSAVSQVDSFGRVAGRWVDDKTETSLQYKFALCPENDIYPGYVTEKPLEAWLCGNVPIWRGMDSARYLNPNCLINAAEMSIRDLVERVRTLVTGTHEINSMFREPFLLRDFDLAPLISELDKT